MTTTVGTAPAFTLLVGTVKGAFLFHTDHARTEWEMSGPHLGGWEVYSILGDSRGGRRRLLAGTNHRSGRRHDPSGVGDESVPLPGGATIQVSDDLGATWQPVDEGPAFAPMGSYRWDQGRWTPSDDSARREWRLNRFWQIVPGHVPEPDTVFAGSEEAGLFVSRDGGDTWTEVSGLTAHPTRPEWGPGAGGMGLHTILCHPTDPSRMWVAASAVGVFHTDDGGASWDLRTAGLGRQPVEAKSHRIGVCPHKLVLDPADPDRLYIQDHGGVYRSTDGGESWHRIENGLGTDGDGRFGFPLTVSADGDLYLVPLTDSDHRVVRDGRVVVFRSTDRGDSWHPVSGDFLPTADYTNVLRDGLAVDSLDPYGVYLGTSAGEIFYSLDRGESWAQIPGRFPRITCVKTWVRR
ncbi:WD40/YVTN/BNR-like repeat-containing protein [Phytoactinopolyspora halotolerans]|uniref:Exo-alpha-sialidase n=1 Tax=Phytoactinopolyspora halotolerans TaxID=1981512 RepID=A0A6L9SI69_9ACTN|nr:sialidase family protein [Phytoactinopolyspora halotolerans]NEE03760.1 exo-alpha-sialidase [Phytoactinopolyspora halotolerans]